jgi:hypothetical protein
MRRLCVRALAPSLVAGVLAISPASAMAGGVFITGHDPDYHAFVGGNTAGAQHILQRAIDYVTFSKRNPKILLVTDLSNPGGDQSDSRLGLTAAGFTYDVADYGSGTPGVLDLHTVNFSNYDAIVIASDYGGWLHQRELDILNARKVELINYVNLGGGLVALAESGNRNGVGTDPNGTLTGRFGFLPSVVSEIGDNQSEVGFTTTAAGQALGLTDADVNGNASHNIFANDAGMDVIDRDASGEIVSLATRNPIQAPPDCSNVTANPSLLWPPNHKFSTITLSGATDTDGDQVTITVTGVTQDEPVTGPSSGNTAPDAQSTGNSNQVQVRAERNGTGDGRVYQVSFTADDGHGGTCSGTVDVSVPHDQSGAPAIDSGQFYNSFG